MYKKTLFQLAAFLLVVVMTLGILAGCGTQPVKEETKTQETTAVAKEGSTAAEKNEPVTLDFWHHFNSENDETKTLREVIISQFQEKFPYITVKETFYDWGTLHNNILAAIAANQLPDCSRADAAWVPEFQSLNALVPLNKEMPDFQNVSSQIMESTMSTAKIGEDYYGLGLGTCTKILFYNKTLLEKAGVAVPATLDEFFAAARALTKKEGGKQTWGYAEPSLGGWNISPFIWSNGGEITDSESKVTTGYFDSAVNAEIFQKLADLYKDGAMTGFNSGDVPATDGFGNGTYAMLLDGPWKFAELTKFPNLVYGTAPMPAGKGGSVQVLGGEDIVMYSSAKKEAAWEFMKFITGKFSEIQFAKTGQIPVNKEAIASETVKAMTNFTPFLEAIKTSRSRPVVKAWSKMDNVINTAVTEAVTGKTPVKEALAAAAKQMDDLLKEK